MVPLKQIQARAKQLGLISFENLSRDNLIRAIQIKEGHDPCFDAPWCNLCEREGCFWREECQSVGISF